MIKNKKINKKSFFKKSFIKIARKIGYELIDQSDLTVITKNKNISENLSEINIKSITVPLGEIKIQRKIKNLLIIFRSFTNENKLLSQNKKRIFEKEKKEYTFRSLNSLCKSIKDTKKEIKNFKVKLKIIDDNSNRNVLKKIENICKLNSVDFELSNLNVNLYKKEFKFKNNKRMQAHNSHIFASKEYAIKSNYDLIYFVEDDYLHSPNALTEMIFTYQKFSTIHNKDIILCPSDYPYLYSKNQPTNVIIGHKIHWRNVKESLCTYMISKKILKSCWSFYYDMMINNYDPYEKPLHKLYKKYNCYSPIPSLALHVTNINSVYGLSPGINYKKFWENSKIK